MNVQIEVNGLARVDFVSENGWVRNPKVELCGIDDADTCLENTLKFFNRISPVPFENMGVYEEYVDGAEEDLADAVKRYSENPGQEVTVAGTIFVSIRPVPKSSQDA